MKPTTRSHTSGRLLFLLLLVLGLLAGPTTTALADGPGRSDVGSDRAEAAKGGDHADDTKGEAKKGEAKKGEAAKGEAAKGEAAKGEAAKEPKGDPAPEDDTEASTAKAATTSSGDTSGTTAKKEAKPAAAPSSGADSGHCIRFSFSYTDGHSDSGTWCGNGMNVTSAQIPGLHANLLHISCSDTFSRVVSGGTTSDGISDLGGHVIEPKGWWIVKDRGAPCGFPNEPPTDPVCHLTVLVKLHGTETLVPGGTGSVTTTAGTTSRSLGGSTDWGQVPCGAVSGKLTSAPAGYTIKDDSDSTTIPPNTRGTLVLTVDKPGTNGPCDGPLTIEVRDADTGALVAVAGATATISGTTRSLDADGRTAGGTFDCGTSLPGVLVTPPTGYTTVDGSDTDSIGDNGEAALLVFTVRRTPGERPCTGPLTIEVVDRDGVIVDEGGATARIAGGTTALDDDGTTAGGSYACDTDVAGTLLTPPTGWEIFDGEDETTVTETGGKLVFVVDVETEVGGVVEKCIGDLIVRVRTTAGDLIDGAWVVVDGDRLAVDGGEIMLPGQECGDITGDLLDPPAGWTPTGPETDTVTIRDGQTSHMLFLVEQLEVGGVRIDRPAPDTGPSGLARTGTGAAGTLALALLTLLVGVGAIELARRRDGRTSLSG